MTTPSRRRIVNRKGALGISSHERINCFWLATCASRGKARSSECLRSGSALPPTSGRPFFRCWLDGDAPGRSSLYGDNFSAQEALSWGFINELVSEEDLDNAV